MKTTTIWRLAPLAAALVSLGAQAQQGGSDSAFSFSGFATLGLVQTNTDDADYVIPGQTRGANKSASGEVDSKLGLQVTGRLNPMFSATAQVLVKHGGEGNFKPKLEWAFGKAQLMPGLALRVGRMGGPFFAVSDFRDVGYANTWLRPPLDVYGQVPVSHFDGVDALYQTSLGSATLSAQLFAGSSKDKVERTTLKFKDMVGFNATAELDGGLTLRVGHVVTKLTVESVSLNQLVATLRAVPVPGVPAIGDQFDPNNKDASFTGLGLAYDEGNFIANFEFTKRRTDTYVADTTGWYGTVGYRIGKFTPYLTLSELKRDSSNVSNTIPAGLSPQLDGLSRIVNDTVASQNPAQKTTALGVRWDAMRNIAIKAQYDRIRPQGGPGLFVNNTAAFGQRSVNVFSIAVDTVF